jgi:hypothetical protein
MTDFEIPLSAFSVNLSCAAIAIPAVRSLRLVANLPAENGEFAITHRKDPKLVAPQNWKVLIASNHRAFDAATCAAEMPSSASP